jgi:hypothetical protein
MQPSLSLDYNSRNGNGIAGVGWSLSGLSSIYRCPNILDTDGVSRPVLHDSTDKLCLDGHRLVLESGSAYGAPGSTYRTEIEQYDRITFQASTCCANDWGSSFQVQHKSGRRSLYKTYSINPVYKPDTWYLDSEYDPQGNCVSYAYIFKASRVTPANTYGDNEIALDHISYTGTTSDGRIERTSGRPIDTASRRR